MAVTLHPIGDFITSSIILRKKSLRRRESYEGYFFLQKLFWGWHCKYIPTIVEVLFEWNVFVFCMIVLSIPFTQNSINQKIITKTIKNIVTKTLFTFSCKFVHFCSGMLRIDFCINNIIPIINIKFSINGYELYVF